VLGDASGYRVESLEISGYLVDICRRESLWLLMSGRSEVSVLPDKTLFVTGEDSLRLIDTGQPEWDSKYQDITPREGRDASTLRSR
jgi:hypothetical protein